VWHGRINVIFSSVRSLQVFGTRLSGLLGIQSVLISLVHFNQFESLLAEELFRRELAWFVCMYVKYFEGKE
jgi:hypothetical protein